MNPSVPAELTFPPEPRARVDLVTEVDAEFPTVTRGLKQKLESVIATGDRNGGVHVWESDTGGIVFSLSEHKEAITGIAWRPDGSILATTGEDGKLVLWSMEDGFPVRALTAHAEKTTDRYTRLTGALDVAYLPDGSLFTSGRDRALRLWQTDGAKGAVFPDLPALPLAAAPTHDGTRALTGHRDGRVLLWDLSSGASQELAR